VLARDISIIAIVQLGALIYGVSTLWHGRPLYYTFSEDRLQLVQASDLDPEEVARGIKKNPQFAPHWYSLPRWVWAPLPEQADVREEIIESAVGGGNDVIQMPRYFRPWPEGLPQLRAHLLTVDQQHDYGFFKKKPRLKQMMHELGFDPNEPVTMIMSGQSMPLLVVFDRETLQIKAYLRSDFEIPPTHPPKLHPQPTK
jgi:hypothetical protein